MVTALALHQHTSVPNIHDMYCTEMCRYARVGSLIMLLHDPSDIFLEAAKLLNYAGLDPSATAAFAGLLCSWLLLRLTLLPFWVIRSCM